MTARPAGPTALPVILQPTSAVFGMTDNVASLFTGHGDITFEMSAPSRFSEVLYCYEQMYHLPSSDNWSPFLSKKIIKISTMLYLFFHSSGPTTRRA